MASNTPNLDLLKKDPVMDGNDTFNIETMLNENWDKIDAAVGQLEEDMQEIEIPLSDATNGTRSNVAGSEKAVGLVMQAANAANLAAGAAQTAAANAQAKANAAETPTGAQAKVDAAVGNLANLQTTAKGNAVVAINELFTSASNGKTAVAAAITGKGVPASGSDTFTQLATKIGQIVTGKRYASGSGDVASGVGKVTISGLKFTPSFVVVFLNRTAGPWYYAHLGKLNPSTPHASYGGVLFDPSTFDSSPTFLSTNTANSFYGFITTDGFEFKIGSTSALSYTWEAYE